MSAQPLPSPAAGWPAPDDGVDRGPARATPAPTTPPQRTYTTGETHDARHAVAAALVTGVVGDLLLRASAPGLGVPLATAIGLALLAWLARDRGRPLTVGASAVGALALVFALAVAWRDSPVLLLLNLGALVTTACALTALVRHGAALPLETAGPAVYARGALGTARAVTVDAPAVIRPALAATPARTRRVGLAFRIAGRGLLRALPALVVFGALLAQADGAFARLGDRMFGWNVDEVVAHVLCTAALAWGAAGYLHTALRPITRAEPSAMPAAPGGRGGRARAAEWGVALALVDALFVVFGVVQLGWLFGGRALVAAGEVTYADYARRGFFELVTVAALALPVALGGYGAGVRALGDAAEDSPALRRALRLAAGTLLACVGVVLVSAADRMRLYQHEYGLTELRFYAMALMGWLGVVGACAAATILRDRPAPFAFGTLLATWGWILALDVVNPDARIVAVNVARAGPRMTEGFDAQYVAGLSADAGPVVVEYLGATPPARDPRGCLLVQRLDEIAAAADKEGWSRWNRARGWVEQEVGRAKREGRWGKGCRGGD